MTHSELLDSKLVSVLLNSEQLKNTSVVEQQKITYKHNGHAYMAFFNGEKAIILVDPSIFYWFHPTRLY